VNGTSLVDCCPTLFVLRCVLTFSLLSLYHNCSAWRVEQARRNGQLLVFSPGGTSSYLEPLPPVAAATGRPSMGGVDGEQVAGELKSIRETMNKLLEAKSSEQNAASAEVLQAEKLAFEAQVLRSEQLATINSKLETTNQKLQGDVKELETKLAGEKETFLVEKTRLEGQLDASKREATMRIQGLEETRKQLSDQVQSMQREKTNLMVRVTDLENEVNMGREKVSELTSAIQTLRSDSKVELDALKLENERLTKSESDLSAELSSVKLVRDDLEKKAAEYEEALDSLENQLLPESESQLKDALDKLRAQKKATAEAEEKLKVATEQIEQMKSDIEALEQEKEEERVQFQALNEESTKAFTKLMDASTAKEEKIEGISQQLLELERDLESEKQKATDAAEEFSSLKSDMEDRMKELESSLNDTRTRLQTAYDEKQKLSEELDDALQQIASLSNAKKEAMSEYSSASANLDEVQKSLAAERDANKRLQDEGRDQQLRIMELEKQLKTTTRERDDAISHMGTFDDREEELYRKLRESDRIRRDLHNRVMQLSGNIRVYVRVRPAIEGELQQQKVASLKNGHADKSKKRKHEEMVEDENPFHFPGVYDRDGDAADSKKARSSVDDLCKNIVEVTEPYKDRGGLNPRRKKWRFGFDHVFSPSEGQEDVWEATEPLVQSAVDGYNVCIFAYGQTGSGKTYTMIGEPGNEGIISRSVSKLFEAKREMEALSRGETKVNLCVELLEIYNEQVRDLLAPNSGPNGREVNLKVTSKEVVGNIIVATSTKEDVMHVLELAQKRRCVKATMSNAESSRSHMLFTIHFNVETSDGVSRTGKLHVCDLAGSERLSKSGAAATGASATVQ
jgi:kinesin family protein C1